MEMYRAKWQFDRSKTGNFYCTRECEGKHKVTLEKNKLEDKLNVDDLKGWLYQQYHIEKMPTRKIAEIMYGKPKNGPNVLGWMERLGIETRTRSEAVALQWVDNDERRAETAERLIKNTGAGTVGRKKLINIMQTEEYKSKSSTAKLGSNNPMYGVTGNKHPQWNPELSDSERISKRNYPEYTAWRASVFERDRYTCQVCLDEVGGNLTAHHINGYHWDEGGRTDINNGITLCEDCHKEFHSIYGYKDVNLFQFSQFLEYKQQALNN
jgi:hypothetical protein